MKNKFVMMPILFLGLSLIVPNAHENIFASPAQNIVENKKLATQTEIDNTKHLNYISKGSYLDSYQGDGVTVAIIDSGINVTHEDFINSNNENIISELSANFDSTDFKNYNQTYTVSGIVKNDGLTCINDENGHGTNVAGIIAAQANGKGIVGIAPNVNLMILKTDYTFNAMNAALRYAADNGADIINMSIQSYTQNVSYGSQSWAAITNADTLLQSSIDYAYNKGCLIVAAAGNANTNIKSYPAANNHVLGVGSLANESMTSKAAFSNYGEYIDLVAPGYVYTTAKDSSSSYVNTQGTSFSSPIVAAVAALYKQFNPKATNSNIEQFLKETCDHIASDDSLSANEKKFGAGSISVSNLFSVKLIEEIVLQESEKTIHIGDIEEISYQILPSDAKFKNISFQISDSEIAEIDDYGYIMGMNYGDAKVKAIALDGSQIVSNEIIVHVVPNVDDYIEISNYKNEFMVGDSFTFDKSSEDKAKVLLYVNGESVSDVISQVTHNEIDMSVLGQKEVVITYKDTLSTKYTITVYNEKTLNIKNEISNIKIEEINLSNKTEIDALYDAYMSLSESEKLCIDITNLQLAKERINNLELVSAIKTAKVDIMEEFKKKREVDDDLSVLTTKINSISEDYNQLPESFKEQTDKESIDSYKKALDFMTRWYQEIRITSQEGKTSRSICEALQLNNGITMKTFIDEYNALDTLTQEIINNAYDTTGDDGSIVTIGNSIKYASNVIALGKLNATDNNSSVLIQTENLNLIKVLVIVLSIFLLSLLIIMFRFLLIKKHN